MVFSKKLVLQKSEFSYPFFQLERYKNMVARKQVYFSRTFLNLWVHISDNIAGVVGARSTTRGGIDIGKKKAIFPLSSNYLDDLH